jgi:hypothetical protein
MGELKKPGTYCSSIQPENMAYMMLDKLACVVTGGNEVLCHEGIF